jgi:hypothetical protein
VLAVAVAVIHILMADKDQILPRLAIQHQAEDMALAET